MLFLIFAQSYLNPKLEAWAKQYGNEDFTSNKWLVQAYHNITDPIQKTFIYDSSDSEYFFNGLIAFDNVLNDYKEKLRLCREDLLKCRLVQKELEDEVVELTYRPGGSAFEEAQKRQVGKYGMKK